MDTLKGKVLEVLDKMNKKWIDAIKEGIESGEGIDLTSVVSESTSYLKDLDAAFIDQKERMAKVKKKGWFGGN